MKLQKSTNQLIRTLKLHLLARTIRKDMSTQNNSAYNPLQCQTICITKIKRSTQLWQTLNKSAEIDPLIQVRRQAVFTNMQAGILTPGRCTVKTLYTCQGLERRVNHESNNILSRVKQGDRTHSYANVKARGHGGFKGDSYSSWYKNIHVPNQTNESHGTMIFVVYRILEIK